MCTRFPPRLRILVSELDRGAHFKTDGIGFVVGWEMFAVLVMAMVIGASTIGLHALTAKGAGGVASAEHGPKLANGASSFLKVCENDYEMAYHHGHDPPPGDRHLGRMADAQVERIVAAERSARCLERVCCPWEMVRIAVRF
jgi:hypothetical protein